MSGWVSHRIGFRLDDASAQPALRQVVHERLADQKTRELNRIHGQFGAAEAPDAVISLLRWALIHKLTALAVGQFTRRADEAPLLANGFQVRTRINRVVPFVWLRVGGGAPETREGCCLVGESREAIN